MQFMDTLSIHTCVARENTQLLRIGQAENMDLCIGSSSGDKSIFRSVKPARRVQLPIRWGPFFTFYGEIEMGHDVQVISTVLVIIYIDLCTYLVASSY